VVLSGHGMLGGATSTPLSVTTGSTILTPHGAGALTLTGDFEIIRCRPPKVPVG
jgi:mannose-6-phosphate isomerase